MLNCNLDYQGYFIINLLRNEKKIRVALMSSFNQEIEVWESNDPHTLCDKCQMFICDASHALYMGRELMRTKQCLIEDTEY